MIASSIYKEAIKEYVAIISSIITAYSSTTM